MYYIGIIEMLHIPKIKEANEMLKINKIKYRDEFENNKNIHPKIKQSQLLVAQPRVNNLFYFIKDKINLNSKLRKTYIIYT